ncbi:MAG: aldehyde dehydrogenase family protein [Miltoncostaeaceae bacterium]
MSAVPRYPLLIGGQRVETESWSRIVNPATGDVVGEIADATVEDADAAVRAAESAWPEWSRLPPAERGAVLERYARLLDENAGRLAELMHAEMGKPLPEAQAEIARANEVVHYFAAEAERLWAAQVPGPTLATGSWIRPAPLGVVVSITPWNFPVALIIWKLAPALAAGNAIVSKPANEAPLAAWTVCELAIEAGLPEGLVNCVPGDGPLLGEALCTHPTVAKVAFTGSRRVAEQISAWVAPRLKALSLELGGHGPLVVLPDADLDQVAEVATVQGYANAGQACYAVNRVLVPRAIEGEVRERIAERIADIELGPLVTQRGHLRHRRLLADAATRGATVLGGEDIEGRRVAPALVTDVGPGTELVDEEPFTPIVAIMGFDDVASAVAEANRPDYGLVGYLCGGDLGTSLEVAQQIECGTVVVNGWRVVVPYAPYAGWRGSGVGAELGRPGLEAFIRWQHLRVLA